MSFALVDAALHWALPTPTAGSASSPKFSSRPQLQNVPTSTSSAPVSSERTVVVITDQVRAEGGFLLNHFIHRHLRMEDAGWNVVLVGVAQMWEHYLLVGKKLGMNLAAYQQKGSLVFLDVLSNLGRRTGPFATDKDSSSNSPLRALFETIVISFHSGSSQPTKKLCLVIDDISALQACGIPLRDIMAFFGSCRDLIQEVNGCLVVLAHGDAVGTTSSVTGTAPLEVDASGTLCKSLMHTANYVLHVCGLESGITQGVDGQVSFARGPLMPEGTVFIPEVLHYQITDAQVNFFKKGFSKGLL
ncbi:hypothetical protein PhCBS80983_g00878 [Powellomyces hirtus]|uniref:Elongator complex protein 6 n=1 Tax=Powellomyces hirtus TaxID=109895 RepID=A0A507EEV1_9FUNG|nr:hypothetical protein PhCBS80983_g00878 [Powellomyces hirtus]